MSAALGAAGYEVARSVAAFYRDLLEHVIVAQAHRRLRSRPYVCTPCMYYALGGATKRITLH